MMLDQKIELLQKVPLFEGLSEEQLEAIANAGEKKFFEAGENLIAEGDKGNAAFLILTGKAGCIRIERGESLTEDLWPGTLVGELGMLVETTHSLTVTASERLRALALERVALAVVMEQYPAIAQCISDKLLIRLSVLATRLREVDDQLEALEKAA